MIKFETVETYALAGIGLIQGIGKMVLREIGYKLVPEEFRTVDMDAINALIEEEGLKYVDNAITDGDTLQSYP